MTASDRMHPDRARRDILKGALSLGGGVALAATVPMVSPVNAAQQSANSSSTADDVIARQAGQSPTMAANQPHFSPDFLANRMFRETPLNFDPPAAPRVNGKEVEAGAFVQTNGGIRFRIFAPTAKDVTLKFDLVRVGTLVLGKQTDGVFEGLLPFDDNHTGPMTVDVYVDGTIFLDPSLPIHWSINKPHNFVEVPDVDTDFILIKDVPHGAMSREIYWAEPIKSFTRCVVYTPPGYMKSTKNYPVLYLQHGGGENEVVWGYAGRVAYILDNLIAAGKAEPFLVVMNNDMLRYPDNRSGLIDDAFERMLIESCIPYIESSYRVIANKWNRALAGLSMGSMMSCDIAFRHPEVFGNLATLTASMTHETFSTTYTRPYPSVMRDAARFAANFRVYFRSTTFVEDHFDYFLADDKLCAYDGIDKLPGYHRTVYPARTTKWNSWRFGLRDYAQLLFR
jgi:enterochelin esterase-like enzyme